MNLDRLFRSSVRGLHQPLLIAVLFSLLLVPLFAVVGNWIDGLMYGLIPALVLAALAGPIAVSAARRKFRAPVASVQSLVAGVFAGAWACFWLAPFNLLVFAKHGTMLSGSDNAAFAASLAVAGFSLSLLPAES